MVAVVAMSRPAVAQGGQPATLSLTPPTADAIAGAAQTYLAEGYDASDNDLGDVTADTTFTIAPDGSGSATGATCEANSCSATAAGTYTVTGTDGTASGTALLVVGAGPVASLNLTPASSSLAPGVGQSFAAEGYDSYGNDAGDVTDDTTFTIAPDGSGSATGAMCSASSCSATVAGTYTVTGTDGMATGTASLQLPLSGVVITWPAPDPISYGTPLSGTQLDATATDSLGNPVPGTFVYSPAAGEVITGGSHALSVTFLPADPASYVSATAANTLDVTASASLTSLSLASPDVTVGFESEAHFSVSTEATDGAPGVGTVVVSAGAVALCSVTVHGAGIGSCKPTNAPLAPGTYSVTATLDANNTLTTSTSAPVTLVVAPPPGPYGTENWAMFQHDPTDSRVSPDTALGASTAPGLALSWKTSIGNAPVLASPAVVYNATLGEDLVYDITVSGSAVAVNGSTGAVVWQQQLPYGIVGKGGADGDVSSPLVNGNTVYYGLTGAVVAMDATTGALQCTFALPVSFGESAPGIVDSSLMVGYVDSTGPTLFFGDKGVNEAHNRGHEWAITGVGNTAGGCQQKWVWSGFTKAAGSWSSPALAQDSTGRWLLVFGSSQPDDSVYALNATTGTKVWHFSTASTFSDADVGAPPTISAPGLNGFADGAVYIDGKDAIEYALDLETGRLLWSFNMLANAGASDTVDSVSGAALVGDTVYVAYDKYVYAFVANTGALVWRSEAGAGDIDASVSVSGGPGDQVLLVGSLKGVESALRLSDGAVVWKLSTGQPIFASAAICDGLAYFATTYGYIYAVGVPPAT